MKILICSDLHGSEYYAKEIINIFEKEQAEKLVFLGDIYNHGPRNPLPKDYNPLGVAKLLNGMLDKLVVVKGNCDSQVDTMISDFDFVEDMCILDGNKTLFLTHGHVYNKDKMPKTKYSAIVYGHFHTGFIEKQGDVVIANTGSLSLPKNDTPNSYILLDNGKLFLKDLQGSVINSVEL